MREYLKNLIAQSLGIEPTDVKESSLLRDDLELDEIDLTEILNEAKNTYQFEVSPEDIQQVETVAELLDLVEQNATEK